MTVEERQLRAWVRRVLRHAAIRWMQRQARQYPPTRVPLENEEERIWPEITPRDNTPDADARLWMIQCLPRLTGREQQVFHALYQGQTPQTIAHQLQCDVSTVRRILYRIRRRCPRSDD